VTALSRIFVSHSRRDTDLALWFDIVFGRERVDAVRFQFEFEAQKEDPLDKLTLYVQSSVVLFVLLTREVIGRSTLHTSNWISAEVGLARAFGRPIWVFERLDTPINFPVPFVDHYVRLPGRLPLEAPESEPEVFEFVRGIVKDYLKGPGPKEPWEGAGLLRCPNRECQTVFQIHQNNHEIDRCPACCTPGQWDMAIMLCPNCKGRGSGFTLVPPWSPCSYCEGSGSLRVDMGSKACRDCDGQGMTIVKIDRQTVHTICESCRGTGHERWDLVQR